MILYVNGQDINNFVIGLIDDDVHLETFAVGPEQYLKTIDGFLKQKDLDLDDMKGIVLVNGPGSATALRASLAIVNSLHYAKKIPLYSIEKDAPVNDEGFVTKELVEGLQPLDADVYAEPVYANAPRITLSKKDALGRRLDS